jgi:hypothetical protein
MTAVPTLRVRFPGRAGELQATGAEAALLAELAAGADVYGRFLADRAQALGGEPDPAAYAGRFAAYGEACAAFDDLLAAQRLLQRAVQQAGAVAGVESATAAAPAEAIAPPDRRPVPGPFPPGR